MFWNILLLFGVLLFSSTGKVFFVRQAQKTKKKRLWIAQLMVLEFFISAIMSVVVLVMMQRLFESAPKTMFEILTSDAAFVIYTLSLFLGVRRVKSAITKMHVEPKT
ncbi:MAG: hypothetical protein WCV85_01225 [Patescibacteria group bacterium]|jgi:hypothetical protein